MYSKSYVNHISQLFGLHGINIPPFSSYESIESGFDEELYKATVAFQKKKALSMDGILGPETLWCLQFPLVKNKLNFEKVDADLANLKEGEGYDHFRLREDVVSDYKNLYKEVKQKGGCITSSGALRDLNACVTKGRSSTSLHYLGLALDLSINSGFQDLDRDVYLVTDSRGYARNILDRYFDVWAKSEDPACKEVRLDAYVWENERPVKREFIGKAFNLTNVMQSHGFWPIRPRTGYYANPPKYICAEWWHFQYTKGLYWGISQFGIELLRSYSERKLEEYDLWRNRKALYSKGAFRRLHV